MDRREIYIKSRYHSGLERSEWGRLFALGDVKYANQAVYTKEREGAGAKGVNKAEALAAQLLAFIHDLGYDLNKIEFDENGIMSHNIPKRMGTANTSSRDS